MYRQMYSPGTVGPVLGLWAPSWEVIVLRCSDIVIINQSVLTQKDNTKTLTLKPNPNKHPPKT